MSARYGFVYFLSHPLMPNIYKIGFTDAHPQFRVDQLSASTSCPVPFDLAACFGCENAHSVEQQIHAELDAYRVNDSREFFKLTASHALHVLREYAEPSRHPVLLHPLHNEVELQRYEAAQRWPVDYFFAQDVDPIFWPAKRPSFD